MKQTIRVWFWDFIKSFPLVLRPIVIPLWLPIFLLFLVFGFLLTNFFRLIHWGRRSFYLRRMGYFSYWRQCDGHFVYEEVDQNQLRSLHIAGSRTEPGRIELYVPSESEWRSSLPLWAKERRQEIAFRMAKFVSADKFHFN